MKGGRIVRRRPVSRWGQFGRAAGRAALGFAGRVAERWAGSRLSGSSSAKTVSTAPLTGERDYRVVYRKKRMPRRKKRRYVRSLKRFRSAMLREEPARIFQYLDVKDYQSGLNLSRYFGAFMGLLANNWYDNNFGEVWNNMTNTNGADLKAQAAKLRVDHMALRVVLGNECRVCRRWVLARLTLTCMRLFVVAICLLVRGLLLRC